MVQDGQTNAVMLNCEQERDGRVGWQQPTNTDVQNLRCMLDVTWARHQSVVVLVDRQLTVLRVQSHFAAAGSTGVVPLYLVKAASREEAHLSMLDRSTVTEWTRELRDHL